ncbi:hypothetical protein PJKIFABJ_00079 [Pseudomonas phage PE09]|uniref:Uncharacterized protein n=1 Tax=Pseudomonas phage PE09 TaxID=2696355 RepID=A0A9E6GV35_9CAUD|nr:hypothetical protein QGX22_gp175 [Pseudomonas phage PE09]QHZ60015.1 hypothetical protein PJKIFABJ_00079 [Pseudomonas phage PE09]
MATIPDVTLTGTAYQNVYAATSIVVGTAVTIQNKSGFPVFIQNIAGQPSAGSKNGFVLEPYTAVDVTGVIAGLWAKGTGPIMVEVIG